MFADDEHALNGTAPYATEMNATWLSHKERVQVISMERDHEAGNKVTHFIALTALGANVRIARSDILLDKEEAMIRELVHLLSGDSRCRNLSAILSLCGSSWMTVCRTPVRFACI